MFRERLANVRAQLDEIDREVEPLWSSVLLDKPHSQNVMVLASAIGKICRILIRVIDSLP